MAGTTAKKFSEAESEIRALVEKHTEISHEPLLLAILYDSDDSPGDICLFEIAERFAHNFIDPDKKLLKASYPSTSEFRLPEEKSLVLTLTNPNEFVKALEEDWDGLRVLRAAVNEGNYKTLFASEPRGQELLQSLLNASNS